MNKYERYKANKAANIAQQHSSLYYRLPPGTYTAAQLIAAWGDEVDGLRDWLTQASYVGRRFEYNGSYITLAMSVSY